MQEKRKAISVLTLNTVAFTACFACWMLNGVLVTFLVDSGLFSWNKAEMGWLIGIPVLSGAIFRLPVGILTDKYGGRIVYTIVMLLSAIPMYFLGIANSFWSFFFLSLGFGIAGTSFAVGIAYTSVWFGKERQGTALGVFGAGNAGAALTSMGAPILLNWLTQNGDNLEAWRLMPKYYAVGLLAMAVIFWFLTYSKKVDDSHINSIWERLAPLKHMRVWRFGLYYFLVFGGFVALAQWLIPYFVNVYAMSVATAGLMAAVFSLPSGVVRALGGVLSDKWGARRVMYIVLGSCLVASALLVIPRMDIESPGKGIMARRSGTVTAVSDKMVVVDDKEYTLKSVNGQELTEKEKEAGTLIWPTSRWWQEPVVSVGDVVKKKELLARGVTHIYFQANVWIFTGLVFVVGFMMGVGKAAVYKHIPDYFPNDVGVVGGIVGVLGGLGGFFCPILFGYLLKGTGLWTTCWMFFALLTGVCLWWMHAVVARMLRKEAPQIMKQFESVKQN
ncbi:MAG: nitrate/nitrite transporter [Candidatus Zixiibacteriota bacterium]